MKQVIKLINHFSIFTLLIIIGSTHVSCQTTNKAASNRLISSVWRTDSCGSLGLRVSVADFIHATGYLNNQHQDSITNLLGLPYRTMLSKNNDMMLFYPLLCLEDDNKNCIMDEKAILGYLKFLVDKKTKKVADTYVIIE